jgi:hypothetical protein
MMHIIEHPKAKELYELGYKANLDDRQINEFYRDCKSVHQEDWEQALRQVFAQKTKDRSPEEQEKIKAKRVIPAKQTHASNLMYRLSIEGKALDAELLDVVIASAENILNSKRKEN